MSKLFGIVAFSIFAASVSIAAGQSAVKEAVTVSGPAEVIDGETLKIGSEVFRLWGIDAPEPQQSCVIRGRTYPCGRIAATALMDLVVATKVSCRLLPDKTDMPRAAVCSAAGYDLAEGMVYTGWALAMPRTGTRLARLERVSAKRKRGLWKGEFQMPWEWRAERGR